MGEINLNPRNNVHKKYRQMIFLNPYRFGVYVPPVVNNTFIGGVASTINTPALLAEELAYYPSDTGFDEANIQNFTIVGSDIECYIGVDFSLKLSFCTDIITIISHTDSFLKKLNDLALANYTNIVELDTKSVVILGSQSTQGMYLTRYIFPNCEQLAGINHFNYGKNTEIIYLPNCLFYGPSNTVNNSIFGSQVSNAKIYVHPSMLTINSGGLEADLAYAQSLGATIISVIDFTTPNPITDLSIGTIYATALQLNFTAPTGSTNAIDFYEVYANGVYKNRISGSGGYVLGLNASTSYDIEVKPVDIFYNKSTSNIVTQATASTYVIPTANLISYYKMENNVLDSWGVNNGTATAITYTSGLVGQAAVFNGTTSLVDLGDKANLSFGNGTIDSPFSVCLSFKHDGTKVNNALFSKQTLTVREYIMYYITGNLYVRVLSGGGSVAYKTLNYPITLGTGWNHIQWVYDGIISHLYINGVFVSNTNVTTGTYVAMANTTSKAMIGAFQDYADYNAGGQIDEVSIFNKALTAAEVSEINAKLNSGQSLI